MISKKPDTSIVKEIDVQNFLRAVLYQNGIIEITWDTSIKEIDVIHLTEMREAVFKLGNGQKMPLFFTAHDFLQLGEEGGKYAASKEGVKYTLATAVLVDNLSKKLIFNFFLNFNKPRVPTKAFSNKKDAFRWLEELKNKTM